jgi:hypothetical protein
MLLCAGILHRDLLATPRRPRIRLSIRRMT